MWTRMDSTQVHVCKYRDWSLWDYEFTHLKYLSALITEDKSLRHCSHINHLISLIISLTGAIMVSLAYAIANMPMTKKGEPQLGKTLTCIFFVHSLFPPYFTLTQILHFCSHCHVSWLSWRAQKSALSVALQSNVIEHYFQSGSVDHVVWTQLTRIPGDCWSRAMNYLRTPCVPCGMGYCVEFIVGLFMIHSHRFSAYLVKFHFLFPHVLVSAFLFCCFCQFCVCCCEL